MLPDVGTDFVKWDFESLGDSVGAVNRHLSGFVAPAADRAVADPGDPRQRDDAPSLLGQLIDRHGRMIRRANERLYSGKFL